MIYLKRTRSASYALLSLLFFSHLVCAQSITGKVSDALSLSPLQGANIVLTPGGKGSVSDSSGYFAFNDLEPGYYQLRISYLGYETVEISDIWVRSGTTLNQSIGLKREYSELTEVTVRSHQNPIEIGTLSITEEQVNRFAATYYDPARLITNAPDVAVTNDQNNRVSVRGISPNYNVWRLQGVEIVNPNHLTNAGTFSDEPIATGGSVNIISAQMLGKSDFVYGAFAPNYGNSLGGIFDMHLKKGNQRKRNYTVQASLIGIDLASEGPFSENSRATYAVNYRYSFTGLLTNMGVDFGGESIGFQDLSFNVDLPLKNGNELSFFALGGLNFNNFDAFRLEESEIAKHRSDIYLDGRMAGTGVSYRHKLGGGYANHSFAVSGSQNIRQQNYYDSTQTITSTRLTDQVNQIISWHSRFVSPLKKGSLGYGVLANYYHYGGETTQSNFNLDQVLVNPHFNFEYRLFNRLHADIGLNYLADNNNNQALDPRLGFTYFLSKDIDLYLRGGYFSQLLNPYNYYFVFGSNGGDFLTDTANFYIQQSQRISLGIKKSWSSWEVNLEGFYYNLPNISVWDGTTELKSDARTAGISAVANRNYVSNWYLNGGATIYNSTWGREVVNDNRFNTNFNLNVNAGREWSKHKETKLRIFSVNGRIMYQGGLKDPFFTNEDLSTVPPRTMAVTNNAEFFRLDLRVQWTWNKAGRSSSLAIDLQNALNSQNEAYTYFDSFTQQVEVQYQLGLIPILTYRVEF
jgi:hypothetical protein